MTYNYQYFLNPLNENSKNIQILDSFGLIRWTINPFFITNTLVNNNVVKINLKNDKIILLNFNNNNEAKLAIVSLQTQVDELVQKTPQSIDKNIENYIEDYVQKEIDDISYYDLNDIPFILSNNDRLVAEKEVRFDDGILMGMDNSIKWFNGTNSNLLISAYAPTESNEKLSISYDLEDNKTLLKIKTWNGNQPYEYNFLDGNIILENSGDLIRDGNSVLYRYKGTSSTPLQLPNVNSVVTIQTGDRLGFEQGQSLLVYNTIYDHYMVDDYVDDVGYFFIGDVTGYSFSSGILEMVVNYSSGFGLTNNDGIVPTYSSWTLVTSPPVMADDPKFQKITEVLNTSTAGSTISYDFNLGSIWIHNDLNGNFDASFLNIPEINNRSIANKIIVYQGPTAYLPQSIYINGGSHSIWWLGGTPPTPNNNQTDIFDFSFIKYENSWKVFGQMNTYNL